MDRSRRRRRALRMILAATLGLGILGGVGVAVGVASAGDGGDSGVVYTPPTDAPSSPDQVMGPDETSWG
jgi:hypothetical protein